MRIEQFVVAYGVEQDRIRAILPEGYESLRPVFRFNAEIRGESQNAAVIPCEQVLGGYKVIFERNDI